MPARDERDLGVVESVPFDGFIDEVRVRGLENERYGRQVVVLYFGSIGGRRETHRGVCEWRDQPEGAIDQREAILIGLIRERFNEHPAVFGSIPPHAGTLFGFGSPTQGQSEVNLYRLATLNTSDMSLDQRGGSLPELMGCPLDLAVCTVEYGLWQKAQTLGEYANAPRDPRMIARMVAPNKVSSML